MATKALIRSGELFPTVFNDFFRPWNEWFENGANFLGKPISVPAVNVTENAKDFKLSIAAPGLRKEDFKIDVDGNMLTISSETREEKEEKDESTQRRSTTILPFPGAFPYRKT
jgi:HSP20 family protein